MAVRLPSTEAPMAESRTGMAAPMAMPMMIGSAMEKSMMPVEASACRMPTAAEADCSTQVKSVPKRMPRKGLENEVRMRIKVGSSRSGDTAADIVDMPNIRTAKPIRISPMCFLAGSLLAMRSTIPITEITPVSVAVENRSIQPPVEPISERQMIQPVMDVPRMAPSTMEIDCRTFIIPELTKPTTMTDVAEDDWITAVTPVPSRKPLTGLPVSRYRISSSLLPATCFSPSPISAMPNRNSAMPLNREITFEIPNA